MHAWEVKNHYHYFDDYYCELLLLLLLCCQQYRAILRVSIISIHSMRSMESRFDCTWQRKRSRKQCQLNINWILRRTNNGEIKMKWNVETTTKQDSQFVNCGVRWRNTLNASNATFRLSPFACRLSFATFHLLHASFTFELLLFLAFFSFLWMFHFHSAASSARHSAVTTRWTWNTKSVFLTADLRSPCWEWVLHSYCSLCSMFSVTVKLESHLIAEVPLTYIFCSAARESR